MKNRKIVITAFVLVAAMLMAVGFAAMADDLFVEGTAKITAENAEQAFGEDIYFTKAVMSENKGTAVIGVDKNGEAADKVTITLNDDALKGAGDSVICSLEISNVGDIKAWVQLNGIIVSNDTYFKVTTSWGNTNVMELPEGETLDVVVTITCIKTPQAEVSTTFDLTYTALDYDPNTVVGA